MDGMDYSGFLSKRAQDADGHGFDPIVLPEFLFPFQNALVDWAVRQGRGALFADCGLGKTPMELVWAQNVGKFTDKPILVLTPLAVGFQIVREANEKFAADAAISRDGTVVAPITVTNYEQIEKFNPDDFGGVVCDESSAIKAYDGQRRALVTEFMRTIPYRLLGTATAAPNDYIELGTASEAFGELGYMDMLNRFFINKDRTSDTKGRYRGFSAPRAWEEKGWRFKGHSEDAFWRWVSSWARAIRKPSDYGFEDNGFLLPELEHRVHVVDPRTPNPDRLFDTEAIGIHEEREELRRSIDERCEMAADVLKDADSAVAWCYLNEESKKLSKMIDGAVEVSGSDTSDAKEEKLRAFSEGEIRVLVTKPIIGAWGLNWQHCHRMTFFPSHSYEQYYQAVRRSWRFGQKETVTVDIITTPGGANALENLQRKAAQADRMFGELVAHMNDAMNIKRTTDFTTPVEVPAWLKSLTN